MNELLTKLPDLKQNINLTKSSLNKFYKDLQKGKDELNASNPGYACSPIAFLDNYPDNLRIPSTDFVDPEIYDFLNKSTGFYQQFNANIGGRQFTIRLYLPSENSNTKDNHVADFFQDCIKKVYLWLHFIVPYIKGSCSMKSSIYLLLSPFKKRLPRQGEPITATHVNSAFTTSCSPETYIYIFRHEEWFKVLLHESFHCFGLDFSHYNNFEVEDKIAKTLSVRNKGGIRVYEAYVEVWADVLNIVLVSYLKTKDKKNFLILFEHLLNKELSFTLFQCTKILNHINFSYNNLIGTNCRTIQYEESCNLTSYYLLKLVLFINLRKFEAWCKKNNSSLFKFDKSNMIKFVDFIIEQSNAPALQTSLKKMIAFFHNTALSHVAKKTTMMTIIK